MLEDYFLSLTLALILNLSILNDLILLTKVLFNLINTFAKDNKFSIIQ